MKFRRSKTDDNSFARRAAFGRAGGTRSVFSYYASRSPKPGAKGRVEALRTQRIRWHYIPSLLAFLAIVVSIFYVLKLDTNPRVTLNDNHQAVALRGIEIYQRAAHDALNSSLLNHNKLTVDTGAVVRSLKQQFPELDQVAVTLPLMGHRPLVELSVVQPVMLLTSSNGVFVIASSGKAVTAASQTTSSKLKDLPKVTDNSGLKIEPGKAALPQAEVAFVDTLSKQLKTQKLTVTSMTLPISPSEVDVRLEGLNYFIKFNTAGDARVQVGSLIAVRQKLDGDHVAPKEYVDVRVEEKVFYK